MSEPPLDQARVAKLSKALRRPVRSEPFAFLGLRRWLRLRPEDIAVTVHEVDSAALRTADADVFLRRYWVIVRDGVLNVLAGRGTGEDD